MKQHITKSQINELSKQGKQKLIEYAKKNNIGTRILEIDNEFVEFAPLPSIGQMIEFLRVHDCLAFELIYINSGPNIGINLRCSTGKRADKWYAAENDCDALWKAVKELL